MSTAHYISRTLHKYIKRYHCCVECDGGDYYYLPLLRHMYVVGGAIRSHALGQETNDIDIVVDTRKLQQLQRRHLFYYHLIPQPSGAQNIAVNPPNFEFEELDRDEPDTSNVILRHLIFLNF